VVTPGGPIGSLTGRAAGQRLARAELSKAIYHPREPLIQRILNGIADLLSDLSQAGRAFPGGWWAAVALAALLAALITVVLTRTGPLARSRRAAGQLMAGSGMLTAADHRRQAGRLAAAGDYAGATLEGVRAIARELDERAVLTPRAGRTANEMAGEAAMALPAEAAALRPYRLRVIAPNGASAAQLAQRLPYGDFRMERLLVLNGVDTAAELARLPQVKIIE